VNVRNIKTHWELKKGLAKTREPLLKGKAQYSCTPLKIGCFVKMKNIVSV
jgi:hypothetical protein